MLPVKARALYIKKEASEDPRSMARVERMLPFISHTGEMKVLDDAAWRDVVVNELNCTRHGRDAESVEPVVIFNQFLYHHTEEERKRREELYPELFRGKIQHYSGYSGFDWRNISEAQHRDTMNFVCQPAYALHTFWGCHFRCAYCGLGNVANINVNLEDFCDYVRESFHHIDKQPGQKLFQWDNGTDVVCWEPEYGGTKMLVELFAAEKDKYLKLYVGKSDLVDFMLDFDHKGHTSCCWSLSTEKQAQLIELRTAGMEQRLAAARKCEEAGYPIRIRFSPMAPLVGWEEDTRHMIRRMFEEIQPEVLTIEPLRFQSYRQLADDYEPDIFDPEYVEAMKGREKLSEEWEKTQFPKELRGRMYRVVLDEVERVSPHTPVGFCRERKIIWDDFKADFDRMGFSTAKPVCACNPFASCDNPVLGTNRRSA